MPVLYVVRFRDEVEFNIGCAKWNSVAGVTFGMIFTAARRTVLECMLAPLTHSRLKIDETLNRIPPFTSYCCRPPGSSGVYEPSDGDVGDLFTVTIWFRIKGDPHVGLPVGDVGHQGMEERSPVADRNELVVRENRSSLPRGFSSVALTAMSVSLSGHALRLLWGFST